MMTRLFVVGILVLRLVPATVVAQTPFFHPPWPGVTWPGAGTTGEGPGSSLVPPATVSLVVDATGRTIHTLVDVNTLAMIPDADLTAGAPS